MSLFLVGMRGAGKTTAGALAASRLGVPFVDADLAIEQRVGMGIEAMFAHQGEASFRGLETELLLEILPRPGQLVSLGAGAAASPEVQAALYARGRVVWLFARVEVLQRRIRGSPRPSLTGLDPVEEVEIVATRREPLYRQCADVRIDTSALSLEEVAHVIEQLWTSLPHHQLW